MNQNNIRNVLFSLKDDNYKNFQSKLMPTVDYKLIIGVRTPQLRKLAAKLSKTEDIQKFLNDVPHKYFDENQLHAFIISEIKDYKRCLEEVNRFLPYVDNWATSDQLSPKVFKENHIKLLSSIKQWMKSKETYTIRFGIGMLMRYFLDNDFDSSYNDMVCKIKSKEYYVNMMISWYFATALAKQYKSTIPYIEEKKLDSWIHNKTIQKAIESNRIPLSHKNYLKKLKIK